MPTKSAPSVTLRHTSGHSVRFGYNRGEPAVDREEVFLYFLTEWRGAPAYVTMEANRYRHSSGMSEWSISARDCRAEPYGADLTDTARRRLSDALRPLVAEWLSSTDYDTSESAAYADAMLGTLDGSRPYFSEPTRDLRHRLADFGHKLTPEQRAQVVTVADTFDAYAAAYAAMRGA